MLKRCSLSFFAISWLGWTCFVCSTFEADAAQKQPEKQPDGQFSSTEPDSVLQKKSFDKMGWMQHEYERYQNAGRQSLAYGEYAEALQYFDQALGFKFEERAAIGKAQCLMKLNRPAEALPLLKQVNETTTSIEAWDLRVACLDELNRWQEALAVCDDQRQSWYPDYQSFLLRSKVYLARGQKDAAIKNLLDGYYHCIRYGEDKQTLRDALFKLDAAPPDTVPHTKSGNEQSLSTTKMLDKLDSPLNERELSASFNKIFEHGDFGGMDSPVKEWVSVDRTAAIEQVTDNPKDGEIIIRSNLDYTYITAGDLARKFGKLLVRPEAEVKKGHSRFTPRTVSSIAPAEKPGSKYIRCKNGWLEFEFSKSDPRQLYFIRRHFTWAYERRGHTDFETHEQRIRDLLELKNFKQAGEELEAHWFDWNGPLAPNAARRIMEQKRQLLISCYFQRPDIQAYLRAAPLAYIAQDVHVRNRMHKPLPTADEYSKHQWFAMSSVIDPARKDAYFTVWAETYPAVYVPQNTALFRKLYAGISHPERLGGGNSTKIGLVDGDLIDQATVDQ